MFKISANYIYPVTSKPLRNGILEIDENGRILNVIDTGGSLNETANLKFYNGIIVPGFINTHCHLELADKKGKITKVKDLADFLSQIVNIQRNSTLQLEPIAITDEKMYNEGIVAVGDISNTSISFDVKAKSRINYYNFIEVSGLNPELAPAIYNKAKDLREQLLKKTSNKEQFISIVPHAPYSVSDSLLELIMYQFINEKYIFSIHNQESDEENKLFLSNSGRIKDELTKIGISFHDFKATGKSSLESLLEKLPQNMRILLVHNIFTNNEDLLALSNRSDLEVFFSICPGSNLFIENKLPDIENFIANEIALTIGTDSYASNQNLSIIEEMKIIAAHFPEIGFEEILKWATLNGAKSLFFDDKLGSFEPGKMPGINLISNFDFEKKQLKANSCVKKLF
jgi:aminodeoxyfutalosine deaminase